MTKKPLYIIEWTNTRTNRNGTTQVSADSEADAKKEFRDLCHTRGMFDRRIDYVYLKSSLKAASKKRL